MLRDLVVTQFEALPRRCLDGLRKTTIILMQDIGCPVRGVGSIPSHTDQQCQPLKRNVRLQYKRNIA
jgi:hypothetical protein